MIALERIQLAGQDGWTFIGGWVAIAVMLALVAFVFVRLRIVGKEFVEAVKAQTGVEPKSFDFDFNGYSVEEARNRVRGYGEEGKKVYLEQSIMRWDLFLPFAYGLLFIIITLQTAAIGGENGWFWLLLGIPGLLAPMLDLLENYSVAKMLTTDLDSGADWGRWARAGSFFTVTKWIMVGIATLIAVAMVVWALWVSFTQ
ncbi:MAG TPA: hypothetical protein VJ183_06670 [Chloroflexia bacterium]|nr:hypothetical protein [Chloroflexia bacterium]